MRRILSALLIGTMAIGCASKANNNATETTDSKAAETTQTSGQEIQNTDQASTPAVEQAQGYEFEYDFDWFYKPFKVNGAPGIKSFIKAIKFEDHLGTLHDGEFDEKNGFFSTTAAGDGFYQYSGAYWNRKDGKKMFIFSFDHSRDIDPEYAVGIERENEWFKLSIRKGVFDGEEYFAYDEAGIVAYLYNPDSQMLEPMDKPPFNNVPKSDGVYTYELPRQGKDITVNKAYTLKFNGLTFDWVE